MISNPVLDLVKDSGAEETRTPDPLDAKPFKWVFSSITIGYIRSSQAILWNQVDPGGALRKGMIAYRSRTGLEHWNGWTAETARTGDHAFGTGQG
jgi:hypothetical protein